MNMEKLSKSMIAIFCVISLMFSVFTVILADDTAAVTAMAEASKKTTLVAIGDSIAFGAMLEDKNDSYPSLMAEKLGLEEVNISVNGYDSEDVLKLLETEEAIAAVKDTDLISLSVGGNNILKLMIKNAMGLTDFSSLIKLISPEFVTNLNSGIAKFETEFPQIIDSIKEINPDATIIVQTVYNPYKFVSTGTLLDFSSISDSLIVKLNNVIISYFNENPDAFILSDVYTAFEEKAEATYLNADFSTMNIDPHPSKEGHILIAETNLAALEAPVEEAELLPEDDAPVEALTESLETAEHIINDIITVKDMTKMLTEKAAEKFKEIVKVDLESKLKNEDAKKIASEFAKIIELINP